MDFAPKTGTTRFESALLLISVLAALYAVSQFLRNSIGVIANDLARELHLTATQTGLLSSAFFFAFAAVQIPIGILIDRYGPKRVMLATAVLTVAGTVLFAFAPSASLLIAARALMGLGCSTFFMAPLVIYARRFPPQRFAGLTSLQMGLANIGTLAATAPLAASAAAFGWRVSFLALAVLTIVIWLAIVWVVPRDAHSDRPKETWADAFGGVSAALKVPSFWPVFFMHLTTYGCFASVIGLWGGPWLSDVHGADLATRGNILLLGATAQICGMLLWGAMDRFWGSYKKPVLIGSTGTVLLLVVLVLVPLDRTAAMVWFPLFGLCVAYTPILTSHGKSLFPGTLTGRGITLMNIGTMGGAFLCQSVTGVLIDVMGRSDAGLYRPEGYRLVFAALAGWLLLSLAFYVTAIDPHPGSHADKA
ncbi:MFS transporter [Microvirga lotononidis]|uniref:Arabinose efflux permease family protein n=1 Tax=Microvirga lotononidis TaxID=864069 RepID=I4YTN4_9HYPH|nr:MFS transporter [Microvirga lotononidis]EIM27326.1 arabinose efflux permease family protein [Microvirga lotononidis]WQO28503.1 MFS transporter [Microvirga lotononidis]